MPVQTTVTLTHADPQTPLRFDSKPIEGCASAKREATAGQLPVWLPRLCECERLIAHLDKLRCLCCVQERERPISETSGARPRAQFFWTQVRDLRFPHAMSVFDGEPSSRFSRKNAENVLPSTVKTKLTRGQKKMRHVETIEKRLLQC